MIRSLEARDSAAWRELFRAYGVFYETDFTEEVLDRVWAIVQRDELVHALVSEVDDVVVGFAHYRYHPDTFSGGWDWFLDDLYVSPDARGSGSATALIEKLGELARERGQPGTLRWITAADNVRAQRVYDRVATKATWVTYEIQLGSD